MRKATIILFVVLVLVTLTVFLARNAHAPVNEEMDSVDVVAPNDAFEPVSHELITVFGLEAGDVIASPLRLSGEARGYWFFEASFPVTLVDWDGRIIAEHYATADGEWMTEEFVPFTLELEFESPYNEGDPEFMQRGALILRKDNPSGLPEHDDALEIPIRFAR